MTGLPALGCDVVDVARLRARMARRPALVARVFTDGERADARRGGVATGSIREAERLATRFAAKEAARKATGDLRLPFHATEVATGPDGAPILTIHGHPGVTQVSMSHDAGVAMAVVLFTALPTRSPTTTTTGAHA